MKATPPAARPTLAALAADLAAGRTTSRKLVEDCLCRISHPDGEGKRVFVKVYDVAARIAAEAQDGCLENFSRRGRCHRFKMHTISQVLNPPGEPIDGELPPPFVKIVGPQFAVHFIAGEHVKDTTHNGVRHGNDGPLLPTTYSEALI